MSFDVQLLPRDQTFLEGCADIPDARRDAILWSALQGLENVTDEARADPASRLPNDLFVYQMAFRGKESYCSLRFFVSDRHAVNGVLVVVFVDTVTGPRRWAG